MIVEVVDAVRNLLPLPAGVKADDTATEPANVKPARLYVWPRRHSPQRLDERDGRFDEADLRLRILLTVAAKGEPRVQRADRALTEFLASGIEAIAATLRDPNVVLGQPLWWDIFADGEPVPDAVRTFDVRGYGLDIVVRLNAPVGSGASS